jgi:hypothetical protein
MEISIAIDENLLSVIKASTKKDLRSIVAEALNRWAKENLLRCPLDESYCVSTEPCNNCTKFKKI